MKSIVHRFVLAMGASILFAATAFAGDTHYRVQVDGINCPFCVYGIEKQLKKLPGVKNVETELELGEIAVEVTDGVTLSEAAVREIIRDAGFTFTSMTHHEQPHSLSGDGD